MAKNKMLSKFNLKDYNNELEIVLEKKAFSLVAKNLLLSMLYKIEVSYKDYEIVKRDVISKEALIEEIIYTINNNCEQIEFVKPKENDITNFTIIYEEKKIICYQNEISLFEALLNISQKQFLITKEYENLANPIQDLLMKGYEADKLEIMANFDGWSWNINGEKTYKSIYAYCYQVLRILMGNAFLDEWKKDTANEKDYLLELKKYSENLYRNIFKIAILLYEKNTKQRTEMLEQKKKFEEHLNKMENKSEYLKEIYGQKRQLNQLIKDYDKIINSQDLLLKEFSKRNEELTKENKIFSISDLADILQAEREDTVTKMHEVTLMAEPKNYIERAKKISEKLDLMQHVEDLFTTENEIEEKIKEAKVELKDVFLDCLEYELEKEETKKELIELLYNYRYSSYLEGLNKSEKNEQFESKVITKACKLKALTIFHEDINYNSRIIKKMISNSIIELENIMIVLKEKTEEHIVEIEVYDGETFDRKEAIEEIAPKGFNVKFGKKVKLVE